jgi:hypothetical protein
MAPATPLPPHLLLDRHGVELALLQHLREARAALQHVLRGGVQVGAELREGRDLAVLRELQLQRARDLLHRRELRRGADARHRQADLRGGIWRAAAAT